jgi:DNA-binding HxlR family transcriptional regulator
MRSNGQYRPVAKAAQILGDRWTLLIVREMSFGVSHFNEMERCLPGISRSVLTQRLRHLEHVGLVERHAAGAGRTVEYRLTAAGRDLNPVLRSLARLVEWAGTGIETRWMAPWVSGTPKSTRAQRSVRSCCGTCITTPRCP